MRGGTQPEAPRRGAPMTIEILALLNWSAQGGTYASMISGIVIWKTGFMPATDAPLDRC